MSLQFISDNSGNTTAVIVPIQEWNAIVENQAGLKKADKPKQNGKIKPSALKRIFSKGDAGEFHKYLTKVRKEWDRDFC